MKLRVVRKVVKTRGDIQGSGDRVHCDKAKVEEPVDVTAQ